MEREGQQCLQRSSIAPADCLNRAGNKGQQSAVFSSFANNKARKKKPKDTTPGLSKDGEIQSSHELKWQGGKETWSRLGGPAIQMADSRRELAENRGCPRQLFCEMGHGRKKSDKQLISTPAFTPAPQKISPVVIRFLREWIWKQILQKWTERAAEV